MPESVKEYVQVFPPISTKCSIISYLFYSAPPTSFVVFDSDGGRLRSCEYSERGRGRGNQRGTDRTRPSGSCRRRRTTPIRLLLQKWRRSWSEQVYYKYKLRSSKYVPCLCQFNCIKKQHKIWKDKFIKFNWLQDDIKVIRKSGHIQFIK